MSEVDSLGKKIEEFFSINAALHKVWLLNFHLRAELAFQEHETTSFVASILKSFAPSLHTTAGLPSLQTAILAVYNPTTALYPPILLRADMDALPIVAADQSLNRTHKTNHHACGHDGHMACLLACAHFLEHHGAPRKVVLFFQPAEEKAGVHGSGAKVAVDSGKLLKSLHEDVVAVYAIHAYPGLALGEFGVGMSVMMGESGRFWVTFRGKGGHAAMGSASGGDALLAACSFVTCVQSVVSRGIDAFENAALAVTRVEVVGSEGINVVAGCVKVGGTARGSKEGVIEGVMKQVERVAEGIGGGYGCTADIWYGKGYGVTRNSKEGGQVAWKAAERVGGRVLEVGGEELNPSLCAEDFSVLLGERGGAYVWAGVGGSAGLHESSFRFPDEGIIWGASFFAGLASGEESGGGEREKGWKRENANRA